VRRLATTLLVTAGLAADSAAAQDSLMKVNEVFPAPAVSEQFVELKDDVASDSFPASSYSLRLFDEAGAPAGSQTFLAPPHPFRLSSAPFLIAASAPADAVLGFPLPAAGGQVCFVRGSGTDFIHCLGYGDVSAPVQPGMAIAPAPPPGQSVQRRCGPLGTALPTRDAENAVCGGGDRSPPSQRLGGKVRQDVDRLGLTVALDEAGTITVSGRVAIRGSARTARFKTVRRRLGPDARISVRLRLFRSGRAALKAALRSGRVVRAAVRVRARDRAGNSSTERMSIRVRD
jgi:hypothetical protein